MPEEELQPVIITASPAIQIIVLNESPNINVLTPDIRPPFDTGVFVEPEEAQIVDVDGPTVVIIPRTEPTEIVITRETTVVLIS
jgi:hypothetical protein